MVFKKKFIDALASFPYTSWLCNDQQQLGTVYFQVDSDWEFVENNRTSETWSESVWMYYFLAQSIHMTKKHMIPLLFAYQGLSHNGRTEAVTREGGRLERSASGERLWGCHISEPIPFWCTIIITTLNQKTSQEQIARQRAFSSHHASFLMLSNKSLSVQQVIPLTITTSSF